MFGKTVITSLFAAAVVVTASAGSAPSQAPPKVVAGAFIYEFHDGYDPTNFVQRLGNEGNPRMHFKHEIFKGMSVQLHDVENAHEVASRLAQEPGVRRFWPVRLVPQPNDRMEFVAPAASSSDMRAQELAVDMPDVWPPHVMMQVDRLRAKGLTGKGVKVAIIDSGIDYKHPALGGCFGPGCLVAFGTDLVGDAFDGTNEPMPDADPMDCLGHGTHVAGIIAAQKDEFDFDGVAPDVKLGIFRIFGCTGQSPDDVLISALIQAYESGADIISASLGKETGWSEDPSTVAASRIVEAGVPCVFSAGNSGGGGLFFSSNPAQAQGATAVGSIDNVVTHTLIFISNYTVDGGESQQFGYLPGDQADWNGVKMPLFAVSLDLTIPDDACGPLPESTPDLSGSIVLIRRGTCTFTLKAANVAAFGATRIIFRDNGDGVVGATISGVPQIVSYGMVEQEIGDSWVSDIIAGKSVELSVLRPELAPQKLSMAPNNKTGGSISTFSSWGPSFEMNVLPQLSAPGGSILSTWPLKLGGFAVFSGTSMSTPQIAGIIALILEARGSQDPILIKDLLATTARPVLFNNGSQSFDFLASVAQQGSGIVQAYDAVFATTLISPSSISFNDTDYFASSSSRNFTINNLGIQPITFTISHRPARSFYTFASNDTIHPASFPNDNIEQHASLSFSYSTLTLNAGEFKTIEVLCAPPLNVNHTRLLVWSGFILINGSDDTSRVVAYQGASGSLHNHVVLESSGAWVANSSDANLQAVANGTSFTIPAPGVSNDAANYPSLNIALALGSRIVRADVVPRDHPTAGANPSTTEFFGTKSIGQPFSFPILFNSRDTFDFNWTGQLSDGNFAPPGNYSFVVRALRIFGDETNEKDWDVSKTNWFGFRYQ